MGKKSVRLKQNYSRALKVPRIDITPADNTAFFKWCLHVDYANFYHDYYGLTNCLSNGDFATIIIPRLQEYSKKRWCEIANGRKSHCHPLDVEKIPDNELQDIYSELKIETAYQLNIAGQGGTHRLWGMRQSDTFYIIANDPEHRGYPVKKKHT